MKPSKMPVKVESNLFKNAIDKRAITRLAAALGKSWPDFRQDEFVAAGLTGLADLELKARIGHLIQTMTHFLPPDYPEALDIVHRAGSHWTAGDPNNSFDGFAAWPLIDWVGTHGVDHPEISLASLRHLTSLFSAEFAIRPYLLQHTDLTLTELHTWVDDDDHHVRRLISEGTRPRLPWGKQLPMFMKDPQPVLELLDKLKDDDSEYVRRSVANNLNDIAKDHPDLVADLSGNWLEGASVQRERLVKHGLRTLIKKGHGGALAALGYEVDPKVKVSFSVSSDRVVMGEQLSFVAEIKSTGKDVQKLVVDFAVHFRKANGSLSAKVFKWKVLHLEPGQSLELKKKHRFVSRSVRKLYAGEHEVEVLVAGIGFGKCGFLVLEVGTKAS